MSTHPAENDYLHSFPEEQAPSAADIPQPGGIDELVQQIKETADKLLRDKANRGDVKLLSTALRELRYAFKVFAPFRGRRKVTVFGSARTAATSIRPTRQAVEFGRRIAEAGFMVVTGAASGIMEAGHVGAGRENSIGVNILLPFEQDGQRRHRRRQQADAPEILLHPQAVVRQGSRRRSRCFPAVSAPRTKASRR